MDLIRSGSTDSRIDACCIRLACCLRERLFIGSPDSTHPVLTYPALKPHPGKRNQRGPGILFGSLRAFYVHDMFYLSSRSNPFLPANPLCPIKLSSRRRPARQKTSVPPLAHATEISFRPKAIYSTCSNPRMWFRSGSGGQRSFCARKAFMTLAQQRAATKPPSSKPFGRPFVPPSGFGSPPIAIAKVS